MKKIGDLLIDRRVVAAIIGVATGMLSLLLYTYSPYDPSWFFYSTHQGAVHNALGSVGSYTASLLVYFFGVLAWVVCLFGLYCTWMVARRASFMQEFDRIIMGGVLLCAVAPLLTIYRADFLAPHYPGGPLGNTIHAQLGAHIDALMIAPLLFIVVWATVIVITRLAFLPLIQYCVRMLSQLVRMLGILVPVAASPVLAGVWAVMRFSIASSGRGAQMLFYGAKRVLYGRPIESETHIVARPERESNTEYGNSSIPTVTVPEAVEHVQGSDSWDAAELDTYAEPAQQIMPEPCEQASYELAESGDTTNQWMPEPEPVKPYQLPPSTLFAPPVTTVTDQEVLSEAQLRARLLEEKLECFGVSGSVVSIKRGPVVTLFEYRPEMHTKLSKIMSLEDDLALALQATSIRILAPIPGTSYVGFEVANKDRMSVPFATIARSSIFTQFSGHLPLILGDDTVGNTVVVDLAKMPHLLIAGSTGSGKSVALNTMLISLLCRCTPQQLRMILIDPKRLEFASYTDMGHLLFPIITEPKRAIVALQWVVTTMEERYEKMAECGVRNIFDYNTMRTQQGHDPEPFIVVVIDELADLMMTTGKEIEGCIVRIAQMARASGIHMIVATQRPSVDVITGLIKVNFPSRISFRVTSKVDSRTILDCSGAEKLLGKGDMLFLNSNAAVLQRVHGAYISDQEIDDVARYIRGQQPVEYVDLQEVSARQEQMAHKADDSLYQDIVNFLETIDEVSISLLQRRFRIGYNRSARIIDLLEAQGHITSSDTGKTRKVVR